MNLLEDELTLPDPPPPPFIVAMIVKETVLKQVLP